MKRNRNKTNRTVSIADFRGTCRLYIGLLVDEVRNEELVSEWICESCVYYPPSSCDGKPCCFCCPEDPNMNCYSEKDGDDDG